MPKPDFLVDINDQSVSVRLQVSPRARFYAFIFLIATMALAICGLVSLPGKHGSPGMWHDLSSSPVDSGGFIFTIILLLSFPVLMGLLHMGDTQYRPTPQTKPFIAMD
jgi:hypothetical protein